MRNVRASWSLGVAVFAVVLGALVGIGGYTFAYAEGLSYFKTDPVACVNCHIMQPQYDAWQKGSHHTSAVCVDCHLPHDFVPKYLAKAENGWRHGKMFTTGNFREPIEVQATGREILQGNCVRCHAELTADERALSRGEHAADEVPCIKCHASVGHGPKAGLGGPFRMSELEQASVRDNE